MSLVRALSIFVVPVAAAFALLGGAAAATLAGHDEAGRGAGSVLLSEDSCGLDGSPCSGRDDTGNGSDHGCPADGSRCSGDNQSGDAKPNR